jgi:hypothetical protein
MGCARCASLVLIAAVLVGGSIGGMPAARADSIAIWNFNTFTLDPTGGTEAASATLRFSGALPSFGGGSTVNDPDAENPNFSLSILGTQNNGRFLTFSASMTDYQSLVVTYATDRSSKGFTTQTWSYSTDDISFTTVSPTIAPGADYELATVDLSGIAALNNAPTVFLKMVLSGAMPGNEGDMFDNFVLSASSTVKPNAAVSTPLPTGAAIGGIGLLALPLWRMRRRWVIEG